MMRAHMFRDRFDAGRQLAAELRAREEPGDAVVLALPRGGVPVGYEVAMALNLPLDVCVVRKLGVPGQPELAMGAIASGGVQVLNESVVQMMEIGGQTIAALAERERRELERRELAYRGQAPPTDIQRRTIILVDDGLATGATMLAAIRSLRGRRAGPIVVAVPVAPKETVRRIASAADECVCLLTPEPFGSIGAFYLNFSQLSDDDVRYLLAEAARRYEERRPTVAVPQ
jgi:putative phosphoribosyl transferase